MHHYTKSYVSVISLQNVFMGIKKRRPIKQTSFLTRIDYTHSYRFQLYHPTHQLH